MTLSERRALAVKNYIVQELPEHRRRRASRRSAAARRTRSRRNTTEAGRQLNRRTDIKVVLATE